MGINAIPSITGLLRGSNVKAKSVRATMKLGLGTGAERALKLARDMILARILVPDEFGLLALTLVSLRAFEALTEVGVKQSVIQNKRGAEPQYLNVAWWMQAIRGLGLFVVAILAAPWISSFYDKPQLLRMLQVSFLAIVFRGFISPRAYVLEKEYKFGRAVLLAQGSGLLGTVVAIGLAFMMRNVWALIIGYVAEAAILCILSYILVPFLPTFGVDRKCLGELLRFARGMLGLPMLTWISGAADIFVLGKIVTDEKLGMYYLAIRLSYFPILLFSKTINPVLLPGLAKKQDDKDSLCRAVLQVTRGVATVGVPFVAFMTSCASGILLLAYGSEYLAVTIPFAVSCLKVLAKTEGAVLSTTYMAVGQPHLHRRFVGLRVVIIVGLIYPAAVYFGLLGVAAVVVLGNFVALLMQIFWCQRIMDLKFGSYVRCYVPGLLMALPVIMTVSVLQLLGTDSPLLVFISATFMLIAAFAGRIFILNRTKKSFTIKREPESEQDYARAEDIKYA